MTKIEPLASPSPPKTFPVVVKEMLGGMGSPHLHKEVRGSINQQMVFGSFWRFFLEVSGLGPISDEILWEQCNTGQS